MGCSPSKNQVVQAPSTSLESNATVKSGPNDETKVINVHEYKETPQDASLDHNLNDQNEKCFIHNNESQHSDKNNKNETLRNTASHDTSTDLTESNPLCKVTPEINIPTTDSTKIHTHCVDSAAATSNFLLDVPQSITNDKIYPNINAITPLLDPKDLSDALYYDSFVETDEQATLDVVTLNEILQQFNIDENQLINLIVPRSYSYRLLLREKYNSSYEQDLVKIILRKTSSSIQYLISNLLITTEEFLSTLLRSCIITSNYLLATELLTAWETSIVEKAKEIYFKAYDTTFADDLYGTLSSYVAVSMKNIMIPLSRLKREENMESSENNETTLQIENSFMNQSPEYISSLLTTQPYNTATLDAIIRSYGLKYGFPITESIDIEFHDDTKLALKKIVSICEDSAAYFSNELIIAISNRQEKRVMDILISRCEVDLSKIVFNYKRNGTNLLAQISEMFTSNTTDAIKIMFRKV
ncbi:uncharacterized protein LOC101234414 isoform X1 [Hydra vulgaris]|uniref:uncharacterized protein LOC101234414 isoform X1 n=1 Tax=Hydra vulgaris TaxID=6087 RepID=UPI0002B49DAD|nr:uncharacterized protein LOC101234414 [Hydra vulgaris]